MCAIEEVRGIVLSVERCSLHDGPGLRTTVFLKGCPLVCLWCHNPESQSFKPELYYVNEKCTGCGSCVSLCANHSIHDRVHRISRKDCDGCGRCVSVCPHSALEIKGTGMPVRDVMNVAMKDLPYYNASGGGLTLSGGEPLAQYDFTRALLRLAKKNGLHTCMETSGYAPVNRMLSVIPYVDLFLYDFKESDEDKHKAYTGVSRSLIRDNLFAIDKTGAKTVLRCPIIPGYNDRAPHFSAIAETANALRHIMEINLMPYHPMGASKAVRIGRAYPLAESSTGTGFPTEAQIDDWLQAVRRETEVTVKKG